MKPIKNMRICSACDGTGEGMYPGHRCHQCHGIDEVVNWAEPDDHIEYEKDTETEP